MKKSEFPHILVHSDLHSESGPFTLERTATGPAVAVYPGDVCEGAGGARLLRSLSELPSVYVAGNHEFWGGDYYERLSELKKQAKLHGVHFLENQSVVVQGVRFLGATLWTDYGRGNPSLMNYGLWYMGDHKYITAARWWTPQNKARFVKQFGEHALRQFEGKFNPMLALELHRKTRAWLKRELAKPFSGPTVVVTHHAPAFEALRKAGISELALNPASWDRFRREDDLNLTKVGSYASEILPDLHYELRQAGVSLWAFGHLHHAMHFGVNGIPVASNPRGRVHAPLTPEKVKSLALFGVRFTSKDIEESQQRHKEHPEVGDGAGYEKQRFFDLGADGYSLIAVEHQLALTKLKALREDLRTLRALARSQRALVADLAGYRADSLWTSIVAVVRGFATSMFQQLGTGAEPPQDLSWLLSDLNLVEPLEFRPLDGQDSYDTVVTWREMEKKWTQAERDFLGTRAQQYSAAAYLKRIEKNATRLWAALGKAPQACKVLRVQHLRQHQYQLAAKK